MSKSDARVSRREVMSSAAASGTSQAENTAASLAIFSTLNLAPASARWGASTSRA